MIPSIFSLMSLEKSLPLATAIYGLRCAAQNGEQEHGSDIRLFVVRHFYMDDGWFKHTQNAPSQSNKIYKITSNSTRLMKAFPLEDLAKGIQDLDLTKESLPNQKSLGCCWEMESDTFTFQAKNAKKPLTHHGVLSVINTFMIHSV